MKNTPHQPRDPISRLQQWAKKRNRPEENLEKEYKSLWDKYCDIGYEKFGLMEIFQEISQAMEGAIIPCPGGIVFDGGCGTGLNFERILNKTRADILVAGDFCGGMLEKARKHKELINHPKKDGIKIINVDLSKRFPFSDNTFDAEVFHASINYLPHEGWKDALKEAYRTTKPGGYVYIVTQTRDFDFSKIYKEESLKEFKKKLLKPSLKNISFLKWLIRVKNITGKINEFTQEGIITYPLKKELLDFHKKLGFTNVEIVDEPCGGVSVVTRAQK